MGQDRQLISKTLRGESSHQSSQTAGHLVNLEKPPGRELQTGVPNGHLVLTDYIQNPD